VHLAAHPKAALLPPAATSRLATRAILRRRALPPSAWLRIRLACVWAMLRLCILRACTGLGILVPWAILRLRVLLLRARVWSSRVPDLRAKPAAKQCH